MKISKSKKLQKLAEHLAYCHAAVEDNRPSNLAHFLTRELAPLLSRVNEDFESLEADFLALKAQIDQANADVEYFFTMYDERLR